MKEIFKPISGYEGLYEISNCGNVKSLTKYKSSGKNSGLHGEIILKNQTSKTGYFIVGLCKNGVSKNHNVHRLVAESFIPNPHNKAQVNHKDGNKTNPHISNLEWATPSENGLHAYRTGLSKAWNKGVLGKANSMSKSVVQISKNGDVKVWECVSDAVRKYGFDSGAISRCCNGNHQTHMGYAWVFKEDYHGDFSKYKNKFNTQFKRVIRISKDGDIKKYDRIVDAERDGFNRTGIIGCCRGYYKTSLGYRWQYAD